MNVPAAYSGNNFFDVPDDSEMGCVGMGMGEIEPYYPDPNLRGGYGGWPDSPQQQMDGPTVAYYAQRLRDVGYDAPITGNARDPDLMTAVAYFQQYKGLEADGLLGPITNAAIDREWNAMNAGPSPEFVEPPPGPMVVPSGPSPYPNVPGDVPVLPAANVEEGGTSSGLILLGVGVAIAAAVGAYVAWGK